MRLYTFDPDTLQPFEVGAWLVSLLGWPSPAEAEGQWRAAEALCAIVLHKECILDPDNAEALRADYPQFAALNIREINARLRTLDRRLRHRMIAARMALGYMYEGRTGELATLAPGMARLSINELSNLVLAESHLSDPHMVERRIWRESRYVIGLAAAFQICARASSPTSDVTALGYPLEDRELHASIIRLASVHDKIALRDSRFGVAADELVQVQQPEILQAA